MDDKSISMKAMVSTEKCFWDDKLADKKETNAFRTLKNQRLCFQLACLKDTADRDAELQVSLKITSPIKDKIKLYDIESVPVYHSTYPDADDDYLRKTNDLYPDLFLPSSGERYRIFYHRLRSFFVIVEDRNGIPAGKYPIKFEIFFEGEVVGSTEVTVEVIDAELEKQKLIYTNWFHADCLCDYYKCEPYSQRHWEIIENFIREAVSEGINMILTPVLTPTLDTGFGWYRTDIGLVDITKENDGYTYNYENLDKWFELCTRCGVEYFEISHLFRQWRSQYAPYVTATVDGEKQRIFGWDDSSTSPEYKAFVRSFVSNLVKHLQEIGVDKKCFFHISDEPNMDVFDSYVAVKDSVIDLLDGYPVIDALSDFEFYKSGHIKMPIPSTSHAYVFLEQDLPMRWTYYCCGQYNEVSNRFLSMPGQRTEIIGVQLYKYAIEGFLQWGYNFYNSACSYRQINPFVDLSGDNWVPAGDTFVVYPAPDGTAYRSLHGMQFAEGLEDLRLLQTCEKYIGREKTLALIQEDFDREITFHDYPRNAEYLQNLKDKIYNVIQKSI